MLQKMIMGSSGGDGATSYSDSGTTTASANQEKTYTFTTGIADVKSFVLVGIPTASAWSGYRMLVEWDKDRNDRYFSFMVYDSVGNAYGEDMSLDTYGTGTYNKNLPKVVSVQNGEVTIKTPSVSDTRWTNFTYTVYAVG